MGALRARGKGLRAVVFLHIALYGRVKRGGACRELRLGPETLSELLPRMWPRGSCSQLALTSPDSYFHPYKNMCSKWAHVRGRAELPENCDPPLSFSCVCFRECHVGTGNHCPPRASPETKSTFERVEIIETCLVFRLWVKEAGVTRCLSD